MSARCNIIIKDEDAQLLFYRHSDGYPSCTGEDLKEFVQGYKNGSMRPNVPQSAGWLVIRGHLLPDYRPKEITGTPSNSDRFSGWKCGAYEPTSSLSGDVEYINTIDLITGTLSCSEPTGSFWDSQDLKHTIPSKEFKTVRFFKPEKMRAV